MKLITKKAASVQTGFSLIELLIVLVLIGFFASLVFRNLYASRTEVGGGERVLEQTSSRIVERRAEAIRLNGEDRRPDVESYIPPLPMDFRDLPTTASLVTEGDADGDCFDDITNQPVTCVSRVTGANWQIARRNDALVLPDQWTLALSTRDLGDIPLIAGGADGRGVPAAQIGFDGDGRAFAFRNRMLGGTWSSVPDDTVASPSAPSIGAAQFWAIYFVGTDRDSGAVKAAVAIAVHPSGYIEKFRFNGEQWIGFQNRNL